MVHKPSRQRPVDVSKLIGDRLRVRRQLLGITQKELADRVGLAFQMVSKYETGQSTITIFRLQKFADELQVPLDYLIRGIGEIDEMPDDMISMLADRENTEVLKLFGKIDDPAVRAAFLQMLRTYHHQNSLATNDETPVASALD